MSTSEYQKELRKSRKARHLCSQCGQREAFGSYLQCAECLEKSQLRYELNRDTVNARVQARKEDHLAKGLCIKCSNPAVPGIQVCSACREKRKGYNRRYRAIYGRRETA